MKTLLKNIQSGLVISIVFIFTVGLFCIVYATTYTTLSTVSPGNSLTSTSWNALVNNVNNLVTETVKQASTVITISGSNVGIGTTSPGATLDVNGEIRGRPWISNIYNPGNNDGGILTLNMVSTSKGVCFLTHIRIDQPGASCSINEVSGFWQLYSYSNSGRTECIARCIGIP